MTVSGEAGVSKTSGTTGAAQPERNLSGCAGWFHGLNWQILKGG